MLGSDDNSRKRAERVDLQLARRAIDAVLPVRSKIGDWQMLAARLRAEHQHARDDAQRNKAAVAARGLLEEMAAERDMLRQRTAELPANVTDNGHFVDVMRAIDTVAIAIVDIAAWGKP